MSFKFLAESARLETVDESSCTETPVVSEDAAFSSSATTAKPSSHYLIPEDLKEIYLSSLKLPSFVLKYLVLYEIVYNLFTMP